VKSSEEGPGDDTIDGDYGTWTTEVTKKSSSNFRELLNLVLKLERMAREGRLDKCIKIFMFTDNVVAERAFFRGTSRSPTLFELIVRLTRLQMSGHIFLHVIWVSGKRMQAQGTDGLSRAAFNTGVMAGRKMQDYVPICRTAIERSVTL
jgi:hypothetical protein